MTTPERKGTQPGWKVLAVGPTGTGKTYNAMQLAEIGYKVRILFTEPSIETVGIYFRDRGQPIPENIDWVYVAPAMPGFDKMIESAKKINSMTLEGLSKLGEINKKEYDEFILILTALSQFKSLRTGENLGCVDNWGADTVLVIDSLSGLNIAAMNLVVGSKPVKSMADWGMAMDNLERLLTRLSAGLYCNLIVTAHLEREGDELTGGTQLMASTLGKKLAPRIPRFFSDVIHHQRKGTEFTWSTASVNVDLKTRNLPIKDGMKPDYKLLRDSWISSGGIIEP